MSAELQATITRVGLLFDFVAFFLAAPELLGEKRLLSLQNFLRKSFLWTSIGLLFISSIILFLIILSQVLLFLIAAADLTTLFILSFNSKVNNIIFISVGALSIVFSWLANIFMRMVVHLSSNEKARQFLLRVGVILFILGILFQFTSTF